ncbi:HPF/RaiA family ribosome-associated protein [Planomonospora corallina]|uniref:HPF/RaiA family ribosome-associated protein n=1 Tax=Planomonospora corallina TaxID=1806052 RepID=A0ABV8IFF8_9ACTN
MTRTAHGALTAEDVQVLTHGRVPRSAVERAQEKVAALTRHCGEPVLFTRVRLGVVSDPALEHPATAQAVLDVNGRLVRAHAEGRTVHHAIALLTDRLRVRLDRVARDWEHTRDRRYRQLGRLAPAAGGGEPAAG